MFLFKVLEGLYERVKARKKMFFDALYGGNVHGRREGII